MTATCPHSEVEVVSSGPIGAERAPGDSPPVQRALCRQCRRPVRRTQAQGRWSGWELDEETGPGWAGEQTI